jgi:hypothetical protein
MNRLYLAGPMSGLVDLNYPLFNAEAKRLRALGYDVANPAEIGVIAGYQWSDYMRMCIAKLVTCNMVAMLPGWMSSQGAMLEQHVAHTLGMSPMLASEIQVGPAA